MPTTPISERPAHRRHRRLLPIVITAAVVAPLVGTGASTPVAAFGAVGGDPVVAWNAIAGDAALAACIAPANDPLHESRMYAMTHVAVHDAVNAIELRSQPYAYGPSSLRPSASPAAAVATAAHDVLVPVIQDLPDIFPPECIAAGVAVVEQAYAAALAEVPAGRARDEGIVLGQAAAQVVLALRAQDGSDTLMVDPNYPQGDEPGEYRFTPGTPFAFAPGWGDVTPFVLKDSGQFGAPRPFRVTSSRYTRDFNEVKRLGGDGSATSPSDRTAEQTQIALFWVESSPLAWNRIARTVATSQDLDAWDSARLFGLLNLAMADGYIGSFEDKYSYNFWRPVTAIQLAADDGNRDTEANPAWMPLVTTPPIPDHDSAHAVEGAAAAEVFRRFFRTDRVSFEACSLTLPEGQRCGDATPVLRSFDRFSDAAEENGESRILVGFHFRHAVGDGLDHGKRIADRAISRYLRPVN
ncbi:MAG: vanadium-dependent haloperoxidase [Ilumatobacteraceae bacterium]